MEEKTFIQLREEALALGMPKVDIDKFTSKATFVAYYDLYKKLNQKADVAITNIDNLLDNEIKTENVIKEDKNLEKYYKNKSEKMREYLETQPKVSILIPLESGETRGVVKTEYSERTGREEQVYVSGAVHPFIGNGYVYLVPKGVYVDLPKDLADLVKVRWSQGSEISDSLLINRIDPKTGRPVANQL